MGTVTWEQLERIVDMHDKLAAGVDMDFNYLTLLLVASVVAGLGLALDSSTTGKSALVLFYHVISSVYYEVPVI